MSSQLSAEQAPRQHLNPRQAETAERLFAAGLEELKAVGHEALTIRTVAHRAGVSPATAYSYLASKNHLFAELFWRFLREDAGRAPAGKDAVARVRSVTRALGKRLAGEPELAAAVTPALLSSDPDVARLRLRIGAEFLGRFEVALGPDPDPDVLESLQLAFAGALLQTGIGLMTYTEMVDRLDRVVTVIVGGGR